MLIFYDCFPSEHRYVELFLNSTAGGSNGAYGSQMMGGMGEYQRIDARPVKRALCTKTLNACGLSVFSQATSRLTAAGS